jgi:hypothetical protein
VLVLWQPVGARACHSVLWQPVGDRACHSVVQVEGQAPGGEAKSRPEASYSLRASAIMWAAIMLLVPGQMPPVVMAGIPFATAASWKDFALRREQVAQQ